ncbi:hypothetical protein VTK73DRAFT_4924 [Phialemonium thermophilum]|uniref:Alpha box domain-containing protein n=1 Tax=Phialemonium thermophilum TaxID=223376 RepID=A0ABR3WQY7_9PEZI
MNMIPIGDYLETFCWELIPKGPNEHELRRTIKPSIRKATPALNGFDLLCACLSQGYELPNGQRILFGMASTPDVLMSTSTFTAQSPPSRHAQPTAIHDEFLAPLPQDPVLAAQMVFEGVLSESPQTSGINIIRVQNINQVPDAALLHRGRSTFYQQGQFASTTQDYENEQQETQASGSSDEECTGVDMEPEGQDSEIPVIPAPDLNLEAILGEQFMEGHYYHEIF